MKILFVFGVVLVASAVECCQLTVDRSAYAVVFMENKDNVGDVELFGVTNDGSNANIQMTSIGSTTVSSSFSNSSFTSYLPAEVRLLGVKVARKGIRVEADKDITVFGRNVDAGQSCDAFKLIPLAALGTEYYPMTYWPVFIKSQVTILAVEANTAVTMYFPEGQGNDFQWVDGNSYSDGDELTFTLQEYEAAQIQTRNDLSRVRIVANKDIAVFSGGIRELINSEDSAFPKSHMVTQVMPTSQWGYHYVVSPLPGRDNNVVKFVTHRADTTVRITGPGINTYTYTSNVDGDSPSDAFMFAGDSPIYIEADGPIMVAQFAETGSTDPSHADDPAMDIIPSLDQYKSSYSVQIPARVNVSYEGAVYAIVSIEQSQRIGLLMNGAAVPGGWRDVRMSSGVFMSTQAIPVPSGVNVVEFSHQAGATFGVLMFISGRKDCTFMYVADMCYDNVAQYVDCEDKFRQLGDHTACLRTSLKLTTDFGVDLSNQNTIVSLHNQRRRDVAREYNVTDMQTMYWDADLAFIAEKWAESCPLELHDEITSRIDPGRFVVVGQNAAQSEDAVTNWPTVIQGWYDEVGEFVYGQPATGFGGISHFTQLAWADTNRIGCAYARCEESGTNTYVYVCNYGPGGNIESASDAASQYKPFTMGNTAADICSDCTNNCVDDLCDCGGKTCYNEGELLLNMCQCDCRANFLIDNQCELDCDVAVDNNQCEDEPGFDFYMRSNCISDPDTTVLCPAMCNICPYSDTDYTTTTQAPTTSTIPSTTMPSSTIQTVPTSTITTQSSPTMPSSTTIVTDSTTVTPQSSSTDPSSMITDPTSTVTTSIVSNPTPSSSPGSTTVGTTPTTTSASTDSTTVDTAATSTSTTTSEPRPECGCPSLLARGSYELRDYIGIYHVQDCTLGDKSTYEHADGTSALFYNEAMNRYLISRELGSRNVTLRSSETGGDVGNARLRWDMYMTDSWVYVNFTVECMCGGPQCKRLRQESDLTRRRIPGDFVHMQGEEQMDRPVFFNSRQNLYLRFNAIGSCGKPMWVVTPSRTSSTMVMRSYDVSARPDDVESAWQVNEVDEGLVNDGSIRFRCVEYY